MEVNQNEESSLEKTGDSDVIKFLKCIQEQITSLERKMDHLTKAVEYKKSKEPYAFKSSKESRRSYHGSKERKFSRGKHQGEDIQGDSGFVEEKKPSFGKPFGKPFGKAFKKKDTGKKKDFSFKKTFRKNKRKKENKEE